MCVKVKRQENQFQPEIGRMTDEAIESASLQAGCMLARVIKSGTISV
jgi:hypothetical protein